MKISQLFPLISQNKPAIELEIYFHKKSRLNDPILIGFSIY